MQILNMCSTAQDVPIDGPLTPWPLSVYEGCPCGILIVMT